MEIVIVDRVSKKFSRNYHEAVRYGLIDMGRDFLNLPSKRSTLKGNEFWAVKDVSFSLKKGETLGILGINGSGKTSLLKIISQIIRPDDGKITTKGKVVPLFAKGAGFDPILTGYENIHTNLSLLGMTKTEIEEVVKDVIEFSELSHQVLLSPVKTYSSGMHARLGFACAISCRPDLLIIDEALAVGDMRFRTKCYRKINELKKNGCAIILVAHSTGIIMANCEKGLLMKNGQMVEFGPIADVVKTYEASMHSEASLLSDDVADGRSISCMNESHKTGLEILNVKIGPDQLQSGTPAEIVINFKTQHEFPELTTSVLIKDVNRNLENILDMTSSRDEFHTNVKAGSHTLKVQLPVLNIAPGKYVLKVFISDKNVSNILDAVESLRFDVKSDKSFVSCGFYQPHSWALSTN
jgi:lipopolysaccharide transport system ATP-binding protein